MKAVIYDRASTRNQAENFSRVDAREEGIRIAEQHGFDWEYIKEVGSGKSLVDRPKMMNILDRIAAGEIQVIIVQDFDRLARPEERSDYESIRSICLKYNVLVYTQSGKFDFSKSDDDFIADVKMAVAKNERRTIIRRITTGLKKRAQSGKFCGGNPALGYRLAYGQNGGNRPTADLEVNPDEIDAVKIIFNLLPKHGLRGTAMRVNQAGYRGKKGSEFWGGTIRKIIKNPLYAGFMTWGNNKQSIYLRDFEATYIYRPELKIVPVDVWDQCNDILNRRAKKKHKPGNWGKHLFTGFLVCPTCRGPVTGFNTKDYRTGRKYRQYRCRKANNTGTCEKPRTFTELIALRTVIPFLTQIINDTIQFTDALEQAADKYGRTPSETSYQEHAQAELAEIAERKKRLIDSIAAGVIDQTDAKESMAQLKASEQKLQRDLAAINRRSEIRDDYKRAIEQLRDVDIENLLWQTSEHSPKTFRNILRLIFEPNSLVIDTERDGNRWNGRIVEYRYTDDFLSYTDGGSVTLTEAGITENSVLIDLSQLFITV